MKNLQYHKKQLKEHRQRNIHERAMARIDEIGNKVLERSQVRWDSLMDDLKLQRRNLEPKISPNVRTLIAMVRAISPTLF